MEKTEVEKKYKEQFEKECSTYPYLPPILPPVDRIIVIGDLHGDYKLTVDCLKLARVVDSSLKWTGGKTVVVQIGDQVDRCRPLDLKCDHKDATINDENSDIKILELMSRLDKEARKQGGYVISLLGNHELMNVSGNLNYVSYEGLIGFSDKGITDPEKMLESGKQNRKRLFKRGNEYARFMACTRLSSVIIGDYIFVHAGIIPDFIKHNDITDRNSLYKINQGVRQWLLKIINKDYVADIVSGSKHSMFWTRVLGAIPHNVSQESEKCEKYLEPVLETFNVEKMFIGHTPQFFRNKQGLNETCNGRLWRVDNGASDAFGKFDDRFMITGKKTKTRVPQVLEILKGKEPQVLKYKKA